MSSLLNANRLINTLAYGFIISLILVGNATAHNKVVVIPMAGDDLPAKLTPSTPIANVDTNQNDYTIGSLTVIDNITGLEWQRQDDDINRSWNDAWDYCSGLALDGRVDWRLPDIKELQSIVDYGATDTLIDQVAFPNTDPFYWSASPQAGTSNRAWRILFNGGFIDDTGEATTQTIRCVR